MTPSPQAPHLGITLMTASPAGVRGPLLLVIINEADVLVMKMALHSYYHCIFAYPAENFYIIIEIS